MRFLVMCVFLLCSTPAMADVYYGVFREDGLFYMNNQTELISEVFDDDEILISPLYFNSPQEAQWIETSGGIYISNSGFKESTYTPTIGERAPTYFIGYITAVFDSRDSDTWLILSNKFVVMLVSLPRAFEEDAKKNLKSHTKCTFYIKLSNTKKPFYMVTGWTVQN